MGHELSGGERSRFEVEGAGEVSLVEDHWSRRQQEEDTVFREMASESRPVLYRPFQQDPGNSAEVLVRFSGDSHGLAPQ